MARYLVTGGAGFIGCNLVRFILEQGHDVVVLDNFATGKRENLADVAGRIELREADIRDRAAVDQAVAGCAAVFHEAALGSVPRSVEDPLTSHDANVNGTLTVLEAARAADVRRVIFAASSSAYGERPESPKHEAMVPLPLSPYAASKVACEFYMQAYAACYGMETLSLRYFNVFGPYQDPDSPYSAVIPLFVKAFATGGRPMIHGSGEQSRDFTYIANVVHANLLAADAPEAPGKVMNVACGDSITVNRLASDIALLMGMGEVTPEHGPPRPGDVMHSRADISLAGRVLRYRPVVTFGEGLERTVEFLNMGPGALGDTPGH